MADYKDIVGTTVRSNAGALTSAKTGELFYDSTNLDFIYRNPNVTSAGAWRTGGVLNAAKRQVGGAGSQTAGLVFGGEIATAAEVNETEAYNGATWTEVNNLNTARISMASAGHEGTSILSVGGEISSTSALVAENESWNGTSWTELANLNTARRHGSGDGANNTAAIVFGGGSPSVSNATETWN